MFLRLLPLSCLISLRSVDYELNIKLIKSFQTDNKATLGSYVYSNFLTILLAG